nr:MAG TPA: hypothetical protein [Caudoviricetes sp.]
MKVLFLGQIMVQPTGTDRIASEMSQRLLALMLQGLAQFTESQALFSRHLCVYFTALSIKDRE